MGSISLINIFNNAIHNFLSVSLLKFLNGKIGLISLSKLLNLFSLPACFFWERNRNLSRSQGLHQALRRPTGRSAIDFGRCKLGRMAFHLLGIECAALRNFCRLRPSLSDCGDFIQHSSTLGRPRPAGDQLAPMPRAGRLHFPHRAGRGLRDGMRDCRLLPRPVRSPGAPYGESKGYSVSSTRAIAPRNRRGGRHHLDRPDSGKNLPQRHGQPQRTRTPTSGGS